MGNGQRVIVGGTLSEQDIETASLAALSNFGQPSFIYQNFSLADDPFDTGVFRSYRGELGESLFRLVKVLYKTRAIAHENAKSAVKDTWTSVERLVLAQRRERLKTKAGRKKELKAIGRAKQKPHNKLTKYKSSMKGRGYTR